MRFHGQEAALICHGMGLASASPETCYNITPQLASFAQALILPSAAMGLGQAVSPMPLIILLES